ncbi:ATP-binding protein [Pendulispora rubella]|uniref:histidine kinase n=1 Tax=Pendulispora rubella TaxID=2741070 RepID=A0ABZ2L1C2_9BACT
MRSKHAQVLREQSRRIRHLEWQLRNAEAQHTLAKSEAEVMQHVSRRFQETGIIGVVYWRSDGTITYCNDALLGMLGYSREEFERDGLDWKTLTPPEYAPTDDQAFVEMNELGYCRPYEKAYRAKDGHVVPIQIGSAYWEGTTDGGVCWILDCSERKQAEAERDRLLSAEQIARREAEEANAAKDEFLAVVSHELRTPLTAILGWAKLLKAGPVTPAIQERALETMERNAQLQARLIDDILDVSRIIAGKLALDRRVVMLGDVVEAAADSLRPSFRDKNVHLAVDIDAGLPPVLADANRLQQVVWNVVQNALKFTPTGGHVGVHAFRRSAGEVAVEIVDTGQGIKAEFLPRIFERFRQADSSATRVHRGLGLGLAIVHQLVTLHGGNVWAASDGPGRGAKLTIELPVSALPMARPEVKARRMRARRLDGVHVLVVDDEPDIRELVSEILTEHGARITVVGSVDEAMDVACRDRPDVVVSDIAMPKADGFDLIRRLKTLEGQHGHPMTVCALSALATPQDRGRIRAAGFDAHLSKPVWPDKLVETVFRLSCEGADAEPMPLSEPA